jgi:N-acyl amino acid synthase of PEP-CTERM/exosortase system
MTTPVADAAPFAPYFRSRPADLVQDAPLMRLAFELRFQVYCTECQFLPADHYPDQRETDAFDPHSAHFCAFNQGQELVGYVRLVRAGALQALPLQSHCVLDLQGASRPEGSESAEISRLMVRHDYRRRRYDNLAGVTLQVDGTAPAREKRRNTPQILLSLFRQMYVHSLNQGIRYWYAAMEPALARVLARMDFAFEQVGAPTDYYGLVAPYLADLRALEARLAERNPALLAWLRQPEEALD